MLDAVGHPCLARGVLVSLGLLVSACAGQGGPHGSDPSLHAPTGASYVSTEHTAVATSVDAWPIAGASVKVSLSTPRRAGAAPLIVYVPGLGESSEAGERWRSAWSASGYAVMSVQPRAEDATAWTSDLARAGDFSSLGHQRYAGAAMRRRLDTLAQVLAEAQRRSAAGDELWQRVDWNRVAIAGFDLGAYTAMAIAGERGEGTEEVSVRMRIIAAIAISPIVNASTGSLVNQRYDSIVVPVLSVSSDADGDPLRIVVDPRQRSIPFDRMNGPDKYFLSMYGITHANLSGTPDQAGHGSGSAKSPRDGASSAGGTDTGRQRGGSGRRRSSGEGTGSDRSRASAEDDAGADSLSAKVAQARLLVAQDVTTAFLDAYVKGDSRAREWLSNEATRSLGASGELRRK